MKIAVTSNSGMNIDTHFGKAEKMMIYEVNDSHLHLQGIWNIDSYCSSDPNHKFNATRFDSIYDIIKECSKLYTAKIGDKPAEQFEEKGIMVCLAEGNINKALEAELT